MKRALAMVFLLIPGIAHAFSVRWPVECTLGTDCFIQNFIDHDVSASAHDFACNPSSYNNHDGTDIRLSSLAAMRAGVAVKAIADGVVLGARDGVADASMRDANAPRSEGRECGNGVHIQHADGYRSQSCHLMNGSIRVRTGQQVKDGEVIGNIGLSGHTEFPHVHLGIWKDAIVIDPFTGGAMTAACDGSRAAKPLWAERVIYQPTALLNDGLVGDMPERDRMNDTPVSAASLPMDTPALIYWVELMNVRKGDVFALRLTGPDGSILTEKSTTLEKPMATQFTIIGKKNSAGKLLAGNYTGQVKLLRGGSIIVDHTRRVVVK